MKSHAEHFEDWFGMQPKGTDVAKALLKYEKAQSERMHSLNQQANIAGQRANWAWAKTVRAATERLK